MDEKKYTEANKCFNCAVKIFVFVLQSEEISLLSLKNQVNEQLMFCYNSLDEIDILLTENEIESSSPNFDVDENVLAQIESAAMSKKQTVKFSDVCGMEKEWKLLVNFPGTFTKKRSSFKAFLFYGVRIKCHVLEHDFYNLLFTATWNWKRFYCRGCCRRSFTICVLF